MEARGIPKGTEHSERGGQHTCQQRDIYMCTINFTEKSFKIKQNLTEKGVAAVHLANP